jgi:hypothetical protein
VDYEWQIVSYKAIWSHKPGEACKAQGLGPSSSQRCYVGAS